ncbi:unnamed protein product [Symbiodinium sp. CCMP2592]|nr:unnamed protein product [Symbiodinium sp. CCMP2592]
MMLNRLRKNPARLTALGEKLKDMVMSNDPTTMKRLKELVVQNQGDLAKIEVQVQDVVEANDGEAALSRVSPMTKAQVEHLYGADAEAVMSHKRSLGQIQKDNNVPGGELFLVEQTRTDVTNETKKPCCRTTCIAARGHTECGASFAFVGGVDTVHKVGGEWICIRRVAGYGYADNTPKPPKPNPKNPKRQKLDPTTPLEKGRDLKDKLLKKVTQTTTLETQLLGVEFAEKLLEEIQADKEIFRCSGCTWCKVWFGCLQRHLP